MVRVGRLLAVIVCVFAIDARAQWKNPLIDGDYQLGTFGVLRLQSTTEGDRSKVKGAFVSGNKCAFASQEVLLEGWTEGTTLVAKFRTCVEGSGCQSPAEVALFGVVGEGQVTAYLTLPRGCSAPGIDQRFSLVATSQSLRVAAKSAMEAKSYARGVAILRRLTETPDGRNDVDAHLQLGSGLNLLKRYPEGKAVFERALALPTFAAASAETRALTYYNLACSESALSNQAPGAEAKAVEYLKQAIPIAKAAGLNLRQYVEDDGDLEPIRGNAEFQKLFGKKGAR